MKRQLFLAAAAAVPLAAVVLVPLTANAKPSHGGNAATTCAALPVAAPPGATVTSVTAVANPGGTVTISDQTPLPTPPPITDVPAWCDIVVTLSHPGVGDNVTVKVSLPSDPKQWTGRLQAVGGSAYLAGNLDGGEQVQAVKEGYVATVTDAGVSQNPLDASWGLTADGTVDTGLLEDFASRSLHDMTVVAKAVTNSFYGKPVTYSYWNGCSTGGRQGYAEAQDYPDDYDGILAGAPAVNWDRFAIATLWPQVVFNEEHVAPSQCELEAFNAAATAACDTLDGVEDGVIDNPRDCGWDPRLLVGTKVVCDGQTLTISEAEAEAVAKIWAGPVAPDGTKLWYGPNTGASFLYLANTAQPFFVADSWAKYFVAKDPSLNTQQLTYASFAQLFSSSVQQYGGIIGTDDPDLSAFRDSGGKLLSWQGQADQLVPTQGTVDYRERVAQVMGGDARVDDFYRLFLLPGVAHCGGGNGPQLTNDDALAALVTWVEKGKAPATLPTSTTDATTGKATTRDACPYPQVARYTGGGDTANAAHYRCVKP